MSAFTVFAGIVNAQNTEKTLDDKGRLPVSVWIPEQPNLTAESKNNLENKLMQIATANGMSGDAGSSRFIITANVVVTSKDITPTAPPMHAYSLDVTFYLGDGYEGTSFASHTTSVKGVGQNETKALNAALKNIKTNDIAYQSFVSKGKTKIIEFYNSQCDLIIKEAQSLASQNRYEEAMYKLTGVPEVCKDCFTKCLDAVAPIYKKHIDRECKMKLNKASNIWAANQSIEAANAAGEILSTIEPDAECFGEVKVLAEKIAPRVKEIDGREWQYILKDQMLMNERIKAWRDVGVAYGTGQPKAITFNNNVGRNQNVDYSNSSCDNIISEAQALAKQNKLEEALYRLTDVPEKYNDCYIKCMNAAAPIYRQQIDNACKTKLTEANNMWSANQNLENANAAGELLSSIEPDAQCYGDAKSLAAQIAPRAKEITGQDWPYTLKDQEHTTEKIKAYKNVGVAYGTGQPKTITYNVRGWW